MANKQISISIFFPFLNDWGTVGSLITLSIATAEKYTDDWEVILVDDGSSPKNREALITIVNTINQKNALRHLASRLSYLTPNKIRIIHHEKNTGYGGALRDGFNHASKDLVFYTDCDAQYDPRELSLLLDEYQRHSEAELAEAEESRAKLNSNGILPQRTGIRMTHSLLGMVNGYKIKRNDPWYRTVMGRMYHHIVKYAFKLPIRDTDCDFRLIKKEALERIHLHENTGTICTELVKKIDQAGFLIREVPVHHYWRTSGKSQFFNFKRLLATGKNLFLLWWRLMVRKKFN
ncbi:hypothetical protein A3D77_03140 [Candidatus Gottesmanbacteria bacterium RIFCSPHIGHO2_02_FULL_39_11]|uniref:Glycosyltransferase 2-like domain-containing protein n=1 Tax=Candidatus Gottesmanbacteria bacterium RIFCSPHIGHO2_02_FULL_39_11 TaxID=1798382 RepID=A0A1F5ZU67_9BACT|nr:MAG: hypothetical protein A3D77_03140 [Candidatus Gottesmanbacteria bacterium RIFCSPHIGHO2_02_FULL_39_11]